MQHRFRSKDVASRTGHCVVCGPNTPIVSKGKDEWRCHTINTKRYGQRRTRKLEYGEGRVIPPDLIAAEYDRLFELQGGVCAVCKTSPHGKRLAVDHCHDTGRIRGLLCSNCNLGIGLLGDTAKALSLALDYLRR